MVWPDRVLFYADCSVQDVGDVAVITAVQALAVTESAV